MCEQRFWSSFEIRCRSHWFLFSNWLRLRCNCYLLRLGKNDRLALNRSWFIFWLIFYCVEGICLNSGESWFVLFNSWVLVGLSYFYGINTSWSFIKVKWLSKALKVHGLAGLTWLICVIWKRSWNRHISLMPWNNTLSCIIRLMRSCTKDSSIKVLLVDSSYRLLVNT